MTGGFATPTEVGSTGRRRGPSHCRRSLSQLSLLVANLMKAVLWAPWAVSGTILFIIIEATTFSQVLSFSGVVNGLMERLQ